MPIVISDFTWNQSDNKIIIQVPIPAVFQSKTDVFSSSRYIKASFKQFFFEAILLDNIHADQTKCTFIPNQLIFELTKCKNNHWETLEANLPKQEKLQLKKQSIEKEHQRFQSNLQKIRDKKCELKRVAVREQIDLDTKNRELIDNIKKNEEMAALGDLNQWKAEVSKFREKSLKYPTIETKPKKKLAPPSKPPGPRSTKSLQVIFTPREFPTPCRESALEEETEWLKKQAESRRSAGFISEDIRAEERNPQYLKAKGDEFLKNQNYLGAISAYSFGISLSDKFVDLYIARSEAHLAVGNLNKTVNDCSRALELMKPAVALNQRERALCVGRRGVALFKMGLKNEGVGELKASLKLDKNNEEFQGLLEEFEEDLKLNKENE